MAMNRLSISHVKRNRLQMSHANAIFLRLVKIACVTHFLTCDEECDMFCGG